MTPTAPSNQVLLGASFFPPSDIGVHASENPGGLGAEPPGQHPTRRLSSCPGPPCGPSCSSSTGGSGSPRTPSWANVSRIARAMFLHHMLLDRPSLCCDAGSPGPSYS